MKHLPISLDRLAFIEAYFSSSAFGPIRRKNFEELKNPFELHYALLKYDWEGGMQFVRWVAESSICDLGTALAIYWKMSPSFYMQFENESEASLKGENVKENFIFLKELENRIFAEDFQTQEIQYEPAKDETNDFAFLDEVIGGKWKVAERLKKPSKGRTFPQFESYEEIYTTEEFRSFFQKYEQEERSAYFTETSYA
ncbi:hypothetical protein DLM76_11575 [Leptospira yasudae]|uniref:DUF4274 domain-containing protein n=1 Tax=Leptospira yasudae TaxID=2202201 RepID=A0ABX9M439_9LEPT|nr:DUF4274 domain-containing protein [Leptospira yasudae]RHX80496.1 hypothetical protein DLM77_06215 [Leptospira yasudae]RHX94688.1 hypothetical protein DLM76_11575 [Leptospira yasudae]